MCLTCLFLTSCLSSDYPDADFVDISFSFMLNMNGNLTGDFLLNDRAIIMLHNNHKSHPVCLSHTGTRRHHVTERYDITLPCPDGVRGSDGPTWIREIAGNKQDIRPPSSIVGKDLKIPKVQPGDAGLYYCDGKPAVYLNVLKDQKYV